MASSYLIDVHKKLYCPESDDAKSGFYYGNLDTKTLKMSFGFKENFAAANDMLSETWNSATEAFGKAVDGLINKVPLFKNFKINKDMKLRDKLIMFYIIAKEFSGVANDDSNQILETAKEIQTAFERQYMYNIPVRKTMPRLTVNIEGITVNFAYGACNLFDAKREVWDPIQNIVATFFPKAKEDSKHAGLSQITNQATIPYEQQLLPDLLPRLLGLTKKVKNEKDNTEKEEKIFTYNLKQLTQMTRTFVKNNSKASKLKEKAEKAVINDFGVNLGSRVLNGIGNGIASIFTGKEGEDVQVKASTIKKVNKTWNSSSARLSQDTDDSTQKEIEEIVNPTNNNKDVNNTMGPLSIPENTDKGEEGTVDVSQVADEAQKTIDNVIDTANQNGYQLTEVTGNKIEKLNLKYEKNDIADSVKTIVTDIINLEPDTIGDLTSQYYNTLVDTTNRKNSHVVDFYMGYPNEYINQISQFDKYKKNKYTIHYKDIIVTDMQVTFNENNLDSNGYPLEGSVTISGIWSLLWPGFAVDYLEPSKK